MDYLKTRNENSLYLHPCNAKEIGKIIGSLKNKKSSGDDMISNSLLKQIKDEVCDSLVIMINKSLNSGVFPKQLKNAVIKPLFKSKDKMEIDNYRPISLLRVISKIYERIVNNRLMTFLEKHDVLYQRQYGFRKGMSTSDAILDVIGSLCNKINNKEVVILTLIDLSKAFDTLDHSILLNKLEHYGVRGIPLDWFRSFLSNRSICVKINNTASEKRMVNQGTPQGRVISPTLFNIAINDLPHSLKYAESILFADDTSLISSGHGPKVAYARTNHDLQLIDDWFRSNKLLMNVSKTKQIVLNVLKKGSNTSELVINGNIKQPDEFAKLLGINIDKDLSWETHVNALRGKLSHGIFKLKTVKNALDIKTKKHIYYAFFHSHLQYAIGSWGFMISQKLLNKLQVLQNNAIRVITGKSRRCSVKNEYMKLNILNMTALIKTELSKISYRDVYGLLPPHVSKLFEHINHGYDTRNRNAPTIRKHSSSYYNKTYLVKSPGYWVGLPDKLKNVNYKTFKKK